MVWSKGNVKVMFECVMVCFLCVILFFDAPRLKEVQVKEDG